jgi:hypothetical protein
MFISLDNVDSVDKNIYVWKKVGCRSAVNKPIAILSLASCVWLWKIEDYPEVLFVLYYMELQIRF